MMSLEPQLQMKQNHICYTEKCSEQAHRFYALQDGSCLALCSKCHKTMAALVADIGEISQEEFEVLLIMAF
jgi:hypothetical protein